MVRRRVHRRANDAPLAVFDGGLEVALVVWLLASGNATDDNGDDVCAKRIRSEQWLGDGEELPSTRVKINAHVRRLSPHSKSLYWRPGSNAEVE